MIVLARGQASDCASPALVTYTTAGSILADATAVGFQIFKDGQQVFPGAAGACAEVDVAAPCPSGDRLGPGAYVARWSPPADGPTGAHEIRWFVRMDAATNERQYVQRFDVLAAPPARLAEGYALVSDLREEGITVDQASDARLLRLIRRASAFIERVTGRFFEPRRQRLLVDGHGGRALHLSQPIIAVRSIEIFPVFGLGSSLPVETDLLRIYNRHLSEGLLMPDDRDNPKLEFFHAEDFYGEQPPRWGFPRLANLTWPVGPQIVAVDGLFGFTEADGSPVGRTPEQIEHITKLLVIRELPRMADLDARQDAQWRFRVINERTRDQAYTLQPVKLTAPFTGDPAIDVVLEAYCRPIDLGAA
jgi:hypothetical protein